MCYANCVIISMSKCLPISTNFGTNIPQCNTSGYFFSNFKLLPFISIFSFFWDLAIFLGEMQTTSKSNVYGFYGVI